MAAGVPLWKELIVELRPHLILMLTGPRYRTHVDFPVHTLRRVAHQLPRGAGAYDIEHDVLRVPAGQQSFLVDLVFGNLYRQPFG